MHPVVFIQSQPCLFECCSTALGTRSQFVSAEITRRLNQAILKVEYYIGVAQS